MKNFYWLLGRFGGSDWFSGGRKIDCLASDMRIFQYHKKNQIIIILAIVFKKGDSADFFDDSFFVLMVNTLSNELP